MRITEVWALSTRPDAVADAATAADAGRGFVKGSDMKLTDEHLDSFHEQGYVVVENFYPEDKRAEIAEEARRQIPPWDEIKDVDPDVVLRTADFPYEEQFFNQLILDQDLINFVARILGSEDIHFRYAHNWVRYPEREKPDNPDLHRDNGNNSLLPVNHVWKYGQISSWYFPEDVGPDNAPMRIVPREFGDDVGRCKYLTVPGNTQMIFNTHIWHSASTYRGDEGQRYTVTRIYGRADHYWEGVSSYTNVGMGEPFRAFIGTLTARQREYFRFPPAGHEYYTEETLGLLEEQYPGWNSRGEYV